MLPHSYTLSLLDTYRPTLLYLGKVPRSISRDYPSPSLLNLLNKRVFSTYGLVGSDNANVLRRYSFNHIFPVFFLDAHLVRRMNLKDPFLIGNFLQHGQWILLNLEPRYIV
jgi:hypothetical protein